LRCAHPYAARRGSPLALRALPRDDVRIATPVRTPATALHAMHAAIASLPRRIAGQLRGGLRRTPARRRRRLVCAAVLLAAGGLLGQTPGVLLAFMGVLLALDAVIPVPGASWTDADEHVRRLVRDRRRAERAQRMRRLSPAGLDVLDEGTGWAATAERRALGVQPIPVDSITGTVEGFKARAFDREFRPDAPAAEHWKRLWIAQARGVAMPPISVYRVGEKHFVRDGHHRVSVARDRGDDAIDAEVIELRAAATTSNA
jgi:hypothetical protein